MILSLCIFCLWTGPWLGNCVGFYNYKFFVCTIGFGFLQALFVFLQNIPFMVELVFEWNRAEEKSAILAGVAVVIAFAFIFATLALLLTHIDFIRQNRTTIENRKLYQIRLRRSRRDRGISGGEEGNDEEDRTEEREIMSFDLGERSNFYQIFGDNPKHWFLPVFSSKGDGFKYPVSRRHGAARTGQSAVPEIDVDNSASNDGELQADARIVSEQLD